jgi:alanine-glyoxylate transaminase/serine-glyoxylate transaminase/serine-pyruvate transaminase
VSNRALARLVDRPSSWYLDLNLLSRYVHEGSGGSRVYHHTAPVAMVAALHAGLGVLLEEGLDASWARHAECGRQLQEGLLELGLDLLVPEDHRLPQLTTVKIPDGIDDAAVRRELLCSYGIEIGAGAGQLSGKIWRIGCMGHTARRRNVMVLLGALGAVLGR